MAKIDYWTKAIRLIRKSGWNLQDLSGMLSTPELSLYRILQGRETPGSEFIRRLCAILDCKPEELEDDYGN